MQSPGPGAAGPSLTIGEPVSGSPEKSNTATVMGKSYPSIRGSPFAVRWFGRHKSRPAPHRLTTRPADILALGEHPDYAMAVPTPDHFIPMLYLAGLAGDEPVDPILRGYAFGSIFISSYAVGGNLHVAGEGAAAASLPEGIPPDDTNT